MGYAKTRFGNSRRSIMALLFAACFRSLAIPSTRVTHCYIHPNMQTPLSPHGNRWPLRETHTRVPARATRRRARRPGRTRPCPPARHPAQALPYNDRSHRCHPRRRPGAPCWAWRAATGPAPSSRHPWTRAAWQHCDGRRRRHPRPRTNRSASPRGPVLQPSNKPRCQKRTRPLLKLARPARCDTWSAMASLSMQRT